MGVTCQVVARALVRAGKAYKQVGSAFKETITLSSVSAIDGLEARMLAKMRVSKESMDGVYCAGINGLTLKDEKTKKYACNPPAVVSDDDSDDDDLEDASDADVCEGEADDGDIELPTVPIAVVSETARKWITEKVRLRLFVLLLLNGCCLALMREGKRTLLPSDARYRFAEACRQLAAQGQVDEQQEEGYGDQAIRDH